MAGRDGRTLKPTARRKREARRKGQVPRSQEVVSLAGLIVSLGVVMVTAPGSMRATAEMMRDWLAHADGREGMRSRELISSVTSLSLSWSPAVLAAILAGVAAAVAQGGIVLGAESSRPSLKNLSWARGIKKLSPKEAGYTLARSLLKVVVVGLALVGPLLALYRRVGSWDTLGGALGDIGRAASSVAVRVIVGAVLIGAIDYVVTRRKWMSSLMMNRQEVIDEAKLTEGDPHTKAARKRRGLELRNRRSMTPVSLADVIVTNPTHFAVALAYPAGAPAPQVIAKGTERQARRIRKEAARHGVPIIENKPLARALYRQVRVGSYVPERFFEEVISVLVTAYWRRGRVPAHVMVGAGAGGATA
jgi:flagellar biosynthetic protein FlhB